MDKFIFKVNLGSYGDNFYVAESFTQLLKTLANLNLDDYLSKIEKVGRVTSDLTNEGS